MARQIIEVKINPSEAQDERRLRAEIRRQLPALSDDFQFTLLKRSLDARGKQVYYLYRLEIFSKPDYPEKPQTPVFKSANKGDVHIVGFGPAGMFAALRLLQLGFRPIVLERGKEVKERRRDLAMLNRTGNVNEDSNYCFGEGGAGTFSDGKLYTRSHKRGDLQQMLQWLIMHGASPEIAYEAHPHIGTNKLPAIVERIRERIIEGGGEVLFNTRLEGLEIQKGSLAGLKTSKGEMPAQKLILATGHSARDIFTMLHNAGLKIENKPFALGVRIEHPQAFIDHNRYRCDGRPDYLPPSSYSLVEQVNGRGVFSFCMCPGGIIAPAATRNEEIVVNGWSPSKRNGRYANSGMVVSIEAEDWRKYDGYGALAAMMLQQEIERKAYTEAGAMGQVAPAQRTEDFIKSKKSVHLPKCSYIPGVQSALLENVLPESVSFRLKKALQVFDRKFKGYIHPESVLLAPESRTSSPVRVPRDPVTLEHPELKGLYPCGEGAGYAGGIVSAALDGIKCADRAAGIN